MVKYVELSKSFTIGRIFQMSNKGSQGFFTRAKSFLFSPEFLVCVLTLLVAFAAFTYGLKADFKVLARDVEHMFEDIQLQNQTLKELDARLREVETSVALMPFIQVEPNQAFQNFIATSFKMGTSQNGSVVSLKDDDIIGTNGNGNELKFSDLSDVAFYSNYREGGIDVWFYGKLNASKHWDGFCVLNNYVDDELVALFETVYDDGKRVGAYKSIASQRRNDSDKEVTFQNRFYNEGYTVGETFVYKDFDFWGKEKAIKSNRPIRYDDLKGGNLIQYYNGRIVDGKYDDNTGNAFFVSYLFTEEKERITKTFYSGNFKNGNFNDNSGNAYWITLTNNQEYYYYYEGDFSKGSPKNKNWYTPIEDVRIEGNPSELISDQILQSLSASNVDLKWKTPMEIAKEH